MERGAIRRKTEGDALDQVPEGASDVEVAMFLAGHLDKPCGMEVAPGRRVTLRDFYVQEARRALETMTNPLAREFLASKLRAAEGK